MASIERITARLPVAPLHEIALYIVTDWKVPSPYASPYLAAMLHLEDIKSVYGAEDGRGIVTYFLANAKAWRGEVARMIKKELNRRIK